MTECDLSFEAAAAHWEANTALGQQAFRSRLGLLKVSVGEGTAYPMKKYRRCRATRPAIRDCDSSVGHGSRHSHGTRMVSRSRSAEHARGRARSRTPEELTRRPRSSASLSGARGGCRRDCSVLQRQSAASFELFAGSPAPSTSHSARSATPNSKALWPSPATHRTLRSEPVGRSCSAEPLLRDACFEPSPVRDEKARSRSPSGARKARAEAEAKKMEAARKTRQDSFLKKRGEANTLVKSKLLMCENTLVLSKRQLAEIQADAVNGKGPMQNLLENEVPAQLEEAEAVTLSSRSNTS